MSGSNTVDCRLLPSSGQGHSCVLCTPHRGHMYGWQTCTRTSYLSHKPHRRAYHTQIPDRQMQMYHKDMSHLQITHTIHSTQILHAYRVHTYHPISSTDHIQISHMFASHVHVSHTLQAHTRSTVPTVGILIIRSTGGQMQDGCRKEHIRRLL